MAPSTILKIAHISMATTFTVAVITLYIIMVAILIYGISALIFLHILFVFLAAIFKISYVAQLTALKQLGRPAQ